MAATRRAVRRSSWPGRPTSRHGGIGTRRGGREATGAAARRLPRLVTIAESMCMCSGLGGCADGGSMCAVAVARSLLCGYVDVCWFMVVACDGCVAGGGMVIGDWCRQSTVESPQSSVIPTRPRINFNPARPRTPTGSDPPTGPTVPHRHPAHRHPTDTALRPPPSADRARPGGAPGAAAARTSEWDWVRGGIARSSTSGRSRPRPSIRGGCYSR